MKPSYILFASLVVLSIGAQAATSDDGIVFARNGPYRSGAVIIAPAEGGQYVYSSAPTRDQRKRMRFMLGKPQRDDYLLFSEQEEAALAKVRADQLEAARSAYERAHPRHPKVHNRPKLNWPKVVLAGDRTCVPASGHANDEDWKNHMVCWSAGEQRVE